MVPSGLASAGYAGTEEEWINMYTARRLSPECGLTPATATNWFPVAIRFEGVHLLVPPGVSVDTSLSFGTPDRRSPCLAPVYPVY